MRFRPGSLFEMNDTVADAESDTPGTTPPITVDVSRRIIDELANRELNIKVTEV